jgi:hypothetical protein
MKNQAYFLMVIATHLEKGADNFFKDVGTSPPPTGD